MSLQLKNLQVAGECFLVPWSPILFEVYSDWCKIVNNPVITSGFRRDGSMHSFLPLRSFDGSSKKYDAPEVIEEAMNDRWEYDPTRPGKYDVCLWHENRDTPGCHFHFQVCENTRRRR